MSLSTRQDNLPPGFVNENGRVVYFWYTTTGVIIKWAILLGIILFFFLFAILGRMHAKRRMRKGLMPLAYHRWLIPRRELASVDPRFGYPAEPVYTTYQQPAIYMHPFPPPAYDPNAARPPMYAPPSGASKIDPDQTRRQEAGGEEFAPPQGPPPGRS